MTQELWIPGPLPGMNEVIAAAKAGGRGRVYAAQKATWTDRVAWHAKAARLAPIERVTLLFTWHEATRKRDPDNIMAGKKFVLDGLVLARVIPGDGWAHIMGCADQWLRSDKPGVLVTLTDA